jgi:CP family cyanate transporter-like MFS transporter
VKPPNVTGASFTVAVVLVSINLRLPIGAVAPLLPEIRSDLGMSEATASLLTTLPVLCFAVLAPASAWLGSRTGPERAVSLGLLAVAAGTLVRPAAGTALLLFGTVVLGAGITVGNVLVPVVAHRALGVRAAGLIGLYSAALPGGAAIAAALAAPLAAWIGWRGSLAFWTVAVVLALVAWVVGVRPEHEPIPRRPPVWGDRLAWMLAAFFGAQALAYYALATWLPTLLQDPAEAGTDETTAGWALAVYNLIGIAGSIIAPRLATRGPDQKRVVAATCVIWAVGTAGLAVAPAAWPAWVVLTGLGQGAGIALGLTLIGLRAADANVARGLSGMVQGVGYAVAATGPFLFGALHHLTGSWTLPLMLVVLVLGAMAWAGAYVARPGVVRAGTA